MAKKLTNTAIERARVERGGHIWLADAQCPGLRVRIAVTKDGARRAAFTYRYNDRATGKKKQQSLGQFSDSFGLPEARAEVERLRRIRSDGRDIRAEVARERSTVVNDASLISSRVEAFLDHLAHVKGRSAGTVTNYRRYLGLLTEFHGNKLPSDIRRGDARALIDHALQFGVSGKTGGPPKRRAGGQTLAAGSAFFSWCLEREYSEVNPFSGLKSAREETASGINKRYLAEDELKALLTGIREAMPLRKAIASLLMLGTGLRPNEVCGGQWAEIDLPGRTWEIPAERMKYKGEPHRVHLSPFTLAVLKELRKSTRGQPRYLFPGAGKTNPHMTAEILRDAYSGIEGLHSPITPKVFRATVRTHLQRLGCPAEVRSRISHHQRQSRVEQSYDQYDYDAEAAKWWNNWGRYLQQLEKGADNVVTLKRKR